MSEIKYINDKTRIYLYDILSKQRLLTKDENKEFEKLKSVRVINANERKEILYDLKLKGYIEQLNDGLIRTTKTGCKVYGSLNLTHIIVTKSGEEFLKKELPSEYMEDKHKARIRLFDKFKDTNSILSQIGSLVNTLLRIIRLI